MSTISASTTTTTAYKVTADTTGTLVLQTGATPTTAMTISSAQVVNFANAPTVAGSPLTTSPGGSTTQVQYNNAGAFAGSSNFVFDGTNVGVGTSAPDRPLTVVSATSAGANPWNASQTNLYDSRAMTAGVGGTLQFSGKYTTGGAQALLAWIRGSKTNSTDSDFYGDLLLGARNGAFKFYTAASPTIDGTNQVVTIDVSGNLSVGGSAARGTTAGTAAIQLFNGTAPVGTLTNGVSMYSASGDLSFMDAAGNSYKVGYRNVPQNSQTSAYVLVASDVGKHISITTGGVTCNASIFSAGDVLSIYNNSGSNQTITAGASVTFRLAGTATTGNRTLAQYGVATLLCVTGGATPVFVISGAGVT